MRILLVNRTDWLTMHVARKRLLILPFHFHCLLHLRHLMQPSSLAPTTIPTLRVHRSICLPRVHLRFNSRILRAHGYHVYISLFHNFRGIVRCKRCWNRLPQKPFSTLRFRTGPLTRRCLSCMPSWPLLWLLLRGLVVCVGALGAAVCEGCAKLCQPFSVQKLAVLLPLLPL